MALPFGDAFNFIVDVDGSTGTAVSFLVNALGRSGSGVAHDYGDSGEPSHLDINSECDRHVSARESVVR